MIILSILGVVVVLLVMAYCLGAAFFLTVPIFGEPALKERVLGFVFLAVAIALGYWVFNNLPFSVNFHTN